LFILQSIENISVTATPTKPLELGPAFKKIASHLVERVVRAEWRPGELVPGEIHLAREYGVSVGTIRKALEMLVADGVIERRRGRGTVVRRISTQDSMYSFFRLVADDGTWVLPQDEVLRCVRVHPNAQDRQELGLRAGDMAIQMDRVRLLQGVPGIADRVLVPATRFRDFRWPPELPDVLTMYQYLERKYGVLVTHVEDRIYAASADVELAKKLRVRRGTPLLRVRRQAYALTGECVELRESYCTTAGWHYRCDLKSAAR
jgi:GntR family transcriptional regulator